MEKSFILTHVDHTVLAPQTTFEDIKKLCDEAIKYSTASVCIPPSFIKRAKEYVGDKLTLCTVVGFPLGYSCTESKLAETQKALSDGATEIDMVINIGDAKQGDFKAIGAEISALKKVCGDNILKVIIETCLLNEEEKIAMCRVVSESGADFIKTSTGFSTGGATPEDIALFAKHVAPHVRIKAAGGIKDFDDAQKLLELGATRLGTSRLVKIAQGEEGCDKKMQKNY